MSIQDLASEVSKTVGVSEPIISTFPWEPTAAFPGNRININPIDTYIASWDRDHLKAILAHEMGHIALGHVTTYQQNWINEFSADDFAVKHYKAEFLAALEASKSLTIPERDSESHPSINRRIARIKNEQYLSGNQPEILR